MTTLGTNDVAAPPPGVGEGGDDYEVVIFHAGKAIRKLQIPGRRTIAEFLHDAQIDIRDAFTFAGACDDDSDDEVEPIAPDRRIGEVATGRKVELHCHGSRTIAVEVHYQKETLERRFAPHARVRKVLRWAKRKLKLNDADADNLALFLCDGGEQVRETSHLADVTLHGKCGVCFTLSKDVNIEGVV